MIDELNRLRARMMSVAYRMLGSVADAEDAVQDAFVRYQTAGGVVSTEGFLIKASTRIFSYTIVRATQSSFRIRRRHFPIWPPTRKRSVCRLLLMQTPSRPMMSLRQHGGRRGSRWIY